MAQLLFKLGRWSFRWKWIVIVAWLLIFVAVWAAQTSLQRGFNDQFAIPGTPSEKAVELLQENFPDVRNPVEATGVTMVFAAPEGHTLTEEQYTKAIDEVIASLDANLDGIIDRTRYGNPVTLSPQLEKMVIDQTTSMGLPENIAHVDAANLALLSTDKRVGYTTFSLDVPSPADVTDEQRAAIRSAMDVGREKGLTVETGGAAFGDPLNIKTTSEAIGVGIAFIVLIFTFGSVVAAGLPLITAIFGVGLGSMSILLATHWVNLNNVTPVLAVMLGLAVGIDYALFILSRYRAEYRRMPRDQAAGMAVGTAGSAVVFAGLTVVIALVALSIVNIPFLTYMGLSAALTVSIAVLVALTFVPALLGVVGKYAFGIKIPGVGGNAWSKKSTRDPSQRRSKGRMWVTFVQKVPALILTVVVLGLGALTAPVMRLELSLPNDTLSNLDTTQRKSADLLKDAFGPGINAPFLIVVDGNNVNPDSQVLAPLIEAQEAEAQRNNKPFDRKAAAAAASFIYVAQRFNGNVDVKHAQLVAANEKVTAAQLMLTPNSGPADEATSKLMSSLRAQEAEIEYSTGVNIGITGLTPIQRDVTQRLSDAMPLYLAVVVGLAIFLLLLIFRSIMVPLIAGLGFLLSVGAAFGTTVLFWQEGLGGFVHTPGPLISFMPIFLIGVTFGLAMDYQVFLVSRMREYYAHHRGIPTPGSKYNAVEESVIEGYTLGSRVVTSAALIMIAVFIAFIDQPLPFIQVFGFALGMGVLFDAFFIRMGLIPASMFLLGRATWWIPRWLDRILPTLDIEGTKLEKQWEQYREQEERDAEPDYDLVPERA